MTPIKTYGMAERADYFDFDIRAQQVREPLEQPHRHEYFQIQVNLEGDTRQTISGTTRPFPRGGLSFVLPYRVHLVPHPPGARYVIKMCIRDRPRCSCRCASAMNWRVRCRSGACSPGTAPSCCCACWLRA